LTFLYMIYNKFYNGVDLDGTPLPILIVFLVFIGFLFLFIGLLAQLIINISSNDKNLDNVIRETEEN